MQATWNDAKAEASRFPRQPNSKLAGVVRRLAASSVSACCCGNRAFEVKIHLQDIYQKLDARDDGNHGF
jgi:hypothetical protein